MEDIVSQFASLGAVGIIAGLFLKKYLEDDKESKRIQNEERKEDRELYRNSVKEFITLSNKFAESITNLTNRVENVEETTDRIEKKLDNVLEKAGE